MSSHITSCKWPRRLKKLCFRAIYIICCFAHKRMENAGFCQILGRHASTKCHVTSRPVVGFSQNLFQKMRDTSTKKVTENCHAISVGCATAENFVPTCTYELSSDLAPGGRIFTKVVLKYFNQKVTNQPRH